MKPLSDQNHYEILETHATATRDEIERAYRLALATYTDDSLAGYSVFAEGDAAAVRERIEAAYRVLADSRMRSEYDATLRPMGTRVCHPQNRARRWSPSNLRSVRVRYRPRRVSSHTSMTVPAISMASA